MAIISFWGGHKKQSGQTLSMLAIATQMSIQHNMRCLVVDATFDDDTIERAYWTVKGKKTVAQKLNQGKIDLASGAEGLVSAVASNKTSPEIVANYTKVVFKNRLDILLGLKTKIMEDHEKSLMLYKDLLNAANKYYDIVFVDLSKTLQRDTTRAILETSNIIMYAMPQNMKLIEEYMSAARSQNILQKGNVMPLLTNSDEASKYNVNNVTKYIGEKKKICYIPNNFAFMEAASEAGMANFFLKTRLSSSNSDPNSLFVKAVDETCEKIIAKLQELQLKV